MVALLISGRIHNLATVNAIRVDVQIKAAYDIILTATEATQT